MTAGLIGILKAILFGILEGITEWLPVSSTGHLILLDRICSFSFADPVFGAEFRELFDVVIQLGAILAVVVLYGRRLVPLRNGGIDRPTLLLWGKILVACLPAAIVGLALDVLLELLTGRDLDAWLFNAPTVALMLILYGAAFLLIEPARRGKTPRVPDPEGISWSDALFVGCFQALSIVPGTSRSGSTILGALCLGIARPAAAEFSFFLAIPVMAGASLVKTVGFGRYLSSTGTALPRQALLWLAVGFVTAFIVSLVVIRYLVEYVRRHGFGVFGVYRILLGALVLLIRGSGKI